MMSLRLFVRRQTLGALNLYAAQPDAFTPEAEILADLVAQHAAVALAGAIHQHHLNAALVNRDVLGQAKGILMQRDELTTLQAFQLLVRTSQVTNMKIADVARWLITETENNAHARHSTNNSTPPFQPRPATTVPGPSR
jgi:GAF domain-containing protein